MPEWNATVYLAFANERTQPSIDLAQRVILREPQRIVDIGCGPGNSTEVLRRRWPQASIVGLDNSSEMIDAARQAQPGEEWVLADARAWQAQQPFDLVFSNATLQWLPDHERLCRHLLQQVRPGGALAVQMPLHCDSPLHSEIVEVSKDPAWNDRMQEARAAITRQPAVFYYDILQAESTRLDLWETTYYHVVAGPEAVLDWFRGTGLRPYLQALESDDERGRFEQLLLDRYKLSYLPRSDGRVLFPFRRLFFIAYR